MRLILSILCTLFLGLPLNAIEKWSSPKSKLLYVFQKKRRQSSNELIRLYSDGTYEHLKYHQKSYNKAHVERNIGKYTQDGKRLKLVQPKKKNFHSTLYRSYYLNMHLYDNAWSALLDKKHPSLKRSKKSDFRKPFFMQPEFDIIVTNDDAADKIDLDELTAYLVKGCKSDKEKAFQIARFIMRSIEYDYEYLRTGKYANPQNNIEAILAGETRQAVCAGYANIFEDLANRAGLDNRQVSGDTRSEINDIAKLGGYHAWNIVYYGETPKIFDVTWADGDGEYWLDVAPELMIYSHFPDNPEDQLLANPITQEEFRDLAIAIPIKQSRFVPFSENKGTVFVQNNFHIAFAGRVKPTVDSANAKIFDVYYNTEIPVAGQRFYSVKNIRVSFINDSTHLYIPLSSTVTAYRINVNKNYLLKYKVVNGDLRSLMDHYKAGDQKHMLSYMKSILACIYLDDLEGLKKKVKNSYSLFFDEKGHFILDPKVVEQIKSWDGVLTDWIEHHISDSEMKDDGTWKVTKTIENSFDVNDHLKIVFEKRDKPVILEFRLE